MPAIALKKKNEKKKIVWSYLFSLTKEPQLNWLCNSFGKRITTQDWSRKNSKYKSKVAMDLILNCIFMEMSFFFSPSKSEQSQKDKKKKKKKDEEDIINFFRHYSQTKAKNNKE